MYKEDNIDHSLFQSIGDDYNSIFMYILPDSYTCIYIFSKMDNIEI